LTQLDIVSIRKIQTELSWKSTRHIYQYTTRTCTCCDNYDMICDPIILEIFVNH